MILLGRYEWRVLHVENDTTLLLSEEIVMRCAYNTEYKDVTWADSSLRRYLNHEFYGQFSAEEKVLIAETGLVNSNNPWLGTNGGRDTTDKIFLLGLEDVVNYFGDSGQLQDKNPNSKYWINDQYNPGREARDENGEASWWWLRSPGIRSRCAAYVNVGGSINLAGHYVNNGYGAVRPALYLPTSDLSALCDGRANR